MAKIELLQRVIVRDRDGRIKHDLGLVPSRSWVIAFLENLYVYFKSTGTHAGVEDTGGTSRTVGGVSPTQATTMNMHGPDDNDAYGIVVGTGTTAEANTDYALDTQIAHGLGAGQLDYGATSWTAPAEIGAYIDLIFSRAFYNGSGDTVTVYEIGIYAICKDSGGNVRYFCVVRDVLAAGVAVADMETLTVQYTLRTTV